MSRWRGRIGEQGSELIHAPEAEYIGKGKAHKQYEFGVKVSVAVSNRDNFVVGMLAEPGNPYDGHTLARSIGQVERITGRAIERTFVDRGYRGHGLKIPQVLMSGSKRGLTPQMKKELKWLRFLRQVHKQ